MKKLTTKIVAASFLMLMLGGTTFYFIEGASTKELITTIVAVSFLVLMIGSIPFVGSFGKGSKN